MAHQLRLLYYPGRGLAFPFALVQERLTLAARLTPTERPASKSGVSAPYGYVEGHGCDARGVCTNWFVHTGDWSNGAHSWLRTSAYGNMMGWAFGAGLEVYGVDDCDQYPPSGSISFSNIQTRSTGYQQVFPR